MAMNLIKTMHLKQALINNLGKNTDFGIKSLIRKLLIFILDLNSSTIIILN